MPTRQLSGNVLGRFVAGGYDFCDGCGEPLLINRIDEEWIEDVYEVVDGWIERTRMLARCVMVCSEACRDDACTGMACELYWERARDEVVGLRVRMREAVADAG